MQASDSRQKRLLAPAAAAGAPLTKRQKRQIKQMMMAATELKNKYSSTGFVTISTAGVITKVTPPSQGSGIDARIGDSCLLKRLRLRHRITVGATGLIAAADEFNVVRIVVFRWYGDDTVDVPAVTDILSNIGSADGTVQMYNFFTRDKYSILYDECFTVYNTPYWNGAAVAWAHGVDANYNSPREISIPLKGKIDFESPASVTGTGQLYLLRISDSAFAPNPSCEVNAALEFVDG